MFLNKITAEELYKRIQNENVLVLDVRAEEKYNEFHIEGPGIESRNISKNLIFNMDENEADPVSGLEKDTPMIVTCTTGNSAGKCAAILADKDYDVLVLEGGITAWKQYLDTRGK